MNSFSPSSPDPAAASVTITKTTPTPHPNDFEGTVKMPYPDVAKLLGAQLAKVPAK